MSYEIVKLRMRKSHLSHREGSGRYVAYIERPTQSAGGPALRRQASPPWTSLLPWLRLARPDRACTGGFLPFAEAPFSPKDSISALELLLP